MRFPAVLWLSLALVLVSGPLWAQPAIAPAAAVGLVSVRSQKVLYGLHEPMVGMVTVNNPTADAQTVTVTAWLEWNIDQTGPRQTAPLTVPPGKTAVATFSWEPGSVSYGHALKAQVSLGGQQIGAGEDYFNVCDNFWNVALPYAIACMWDAFDKDMMPSNDPAWVNNYIQPMRQGYYNCVEHFFWAQDDFLGMVPTVPVWWSGQARYRESVVTNKLLIATAHENGIKAITYAKLTGGGPFGMEMTRRHPEWVWQDDGTLEVGRNVQQIHDWDTTSAQRWSGWVAVNYNMNDPAVVEVGIKSLSDAATLFGWDAARWDGCFDVRGETYDLDGKLVEKLTPEQVDAHNAANMRRTKDEITKAHPEFRYGYNWMQGNWKQMMTTNPQESTELCRDGGLIMNELINAAAGVQNPWHQWAFYAPSVADDAEAIRKLGGYYGPILTSDNTPDGKYTNAFAYAAGAHPYYHHLWGDFVTRNSAFIWDNALTRVHDPEKLVQAPANVWWRNWVFERPVDATHRQLIIHLINPPAHPTVGVSLKPEDMPPPLQNIAVQILPAGLEGWTPVRATRLSPEPALREAVPLAAGGGVYKCTVPEVDLWTILVIDMTKGGR
jgi:hypothetical protein